MSVINENNDVVEKYEFLGKRIFCSIMAGALAFMFSAVIYGFNYLQGSFLKASIYTLAVVLFGAFIYFTMNSGEPKRFANKPSKKDSKLVFIMLSSFVLFSFITYPIYRSLTTSMLYENIDVSIIQSYDNRSPTNISYINFKKDMEENNSDKITYYNAHRDDLVSVDTSLVMNLMLIKENIKNMTVKNKIDEIYNDKFISKNEYANFKEYILNNPNDEAVLAQLVSQ